VPYLSSILCIAFAAGLACGVWVDARVILGLSLAVAAGWSSALLSYLRSHPRTLIVSVSCLAAATGWMLGAHADHRAVHSPLRQWHDARAREDEPVVIEGVLRQDASIANGSVSLRVGVERVAVDRDDFAPVTGGVAVGVGGTLHAEGVVEWTAGRRIRAPVTLREPSGYWNHGLPDQQRSLARRGVSLVGSMKSAALVEVISEARWWEEAAARVRARTRESMARHVAPHAEQSAAIATAILIGDRAGLSPEIERRLQEAGTYHVIAISGGNIAVLAAVVFGMAALVGVRGRPAIVVVLTVLCAYAVIASGGVSVLRATVMAAVYLALRLIDLRTAALNAVSLTAFGMLLAAPLTVVDVGFWLTFGATVALVLAASMLWRPRGSSSSSFVPSFTSFPSTPSFPSPPSGIAFAVLHSAAAVMVGTVAVEAVLAPVAAYVFQRVTVAGLFLNLAALPAMTVVQLGAMAVVMADLGGAAGAASVCGRAVHLATQVLTSSATLVDLAPWTTWRVPSPAAWLMAVYYVALAVSLWQYAHRRPSWRPLAATACGLFFWILIAPWARLGPQADGRLHLTLLDVGQGDAMLVTFPNGCTLLVDTGASSMRGDFDIGDRVIGPALRARGLLRLDYLAVTHGDPDHLGGARSLARDFAPREIWWGVPVPSHEPTIELRRDADAARIPWRTLQRGDRLEVGEAVLQVHHPPPADWERQRVRNDDSLVVEVRFRDVSFLLTGDIGREVEGTLLPLLDTGRVTVLKVAHHGSATSSSRAFLERVRPRAAVIGVGRRNLYGHPVPQVLERLRSVGAEVFRTDLDGEVEVTTDGRAVEVRTFTGRRWTTEGS
jgi:competence protein ComEC